ncbi:MAG TPA: hypothetical protein VJ083_08025 [Sedimentibacter sp.]|nr:hypothetical protein [Sedimentibacter sp.]
MQYDADRVTFTSSENKDGQARDKEKLNSYVYGSMVKDGMNFHGTQVNHKPYQCDIKLRK